MRLLFLVRPRIKASRNGARSWTAPCGAVTARRSRLPAPLFHHSYVRNISRELPPGEKNQASLLGACGYPHGHTRAARRDRKRAFTFIHDERTGWPCGTGCLQIAIEEKHLLAVFLYSTTTMEQQEVVRWLEQHAVGASMLNLSAAIVVGIAQALQEQKTAQPSYERQLRDVENAVETAHREYSAADPKHPRVRNALAEKWELALAEKEWLEGQLAAALPVATADPQYGRRPGARATDSRCRNTLAAPRNYQC